MYCVKCGVSLADTEKRCPLCQTVVYHPELKQKEEEPLYPRGKYPEKVGRSYGIPVFYSTVFLLGILIVLLCDLQIANAVTWSGYVIGAILLGYIMIILPLWFRKPNPVIFVPCDFAVLGLYLEYVNWKVKGNWFYSFGLPVVVGIALIVIAVVTLTHYVKGGRLYLYGGASILLGVYILFVEYLTTLTFANVAFVGWSFYPLLSLVLIGGFLIFLGICEPARETMHRKFFV